MHRSSHEFKVHLVPCLTDNYIFILEHLATKEAVAIDPSKSAEVIDFVTRHQLHLKELWITHHHWDHVGGIEELNRRYNLKVVGNENDAARIPKLNQPVAPDSSFKWHGIDVQVMFLNGHTSQHIAYFFPKEKKLFSGDVVFSLGCGRLFEGTPAEMWNSLLKIRALPEETEIYCTHEYTESNLGFVKALGISGEDFQDFQNKIRETRLHHQPTVPTLLKNEKRFNPFLNADSKQVKALLRMENGADVEVFTEIRAQRNLWTGQM